MKNLDILYCAPLASECTSCTIITMLTTVRVGKLGSLSLVKQLEICTHRGEKYVYYWLLAVWTFVEILFESSKGKQYI